MKALVSFVLPAYKASFLGEAIESILNQTYCNFELIIVNDASPENINEIVGLFNDRRIRYFENATNIGGKNLILNWNRCLLRASGEYVILASDDDIYHPTFLQEMMELAAKYPDVDLFHCRLRYIDKNGKFIFYSQSAAEFESVWEFIYNRLFYGRKQAAPEFMFRQTMLLNSGGFVDFPIAWYSDDATWNKFAQNGVAYSSKPLLDFRMSGQNLSTNKIKATSKIKAMKRYIEWMNLFLPTLHASSDVDEVMKKTILENYEKILYSHYFLYIPYISWAETFKELYFIRKNGIFSTVNCIKLLIKKWVAKE